MQQLYTVYHSLKHAVISFHFSFAASLILSVPTQIVLSVQQKQQKLISCAVEKGKNTTASRL